MEKRGRIEVGKTPSAQSGKPSTHVDKDEAVADNEFTKYSYEDAAAMLDKSSPDNKKKPHCA